MGAYLSSPVTEKESEEGENAHYRYGVSAMQGWRVDMEDSHATVLEIEPGKNAALFGVFDGHGGKEVAKFAALYMAPQLVKQEPYRRGDLEQALVDAFLSIDELLLSGDHRDELRRLCGEKKSARSSAAMDAVSVPEGILQYLGLPVPEQGQYRVRVVRPGAQRGEGEDGREQGQGNAVYEIELGNDDSSEDDNSGDDGSPDGAPLPPLPPSAEEVVGPSPFDGADDPGSGDKFGTRKRGRQGMEVDAGAGVEARVVESGVVESGAEAAAAGAEGAPAVAAAAETAALQARRSGEEGGDDDAEGSSSPNDYSTPDEDAYSPPTAGCTAVCALIVDSRLVVANAGDSRCLLSRGGRAVALTTDHKPNDPAEYLRIIKAGGFVADGRVNGSLNLSRALGDMEYKQNRDLPPQEQSVTAFPEVRGETLCAEDEFLVLACDGVWDVLTNQEAVDFVRERLLRGVPPKIVAEEVCARCLAPDTSGCGKGCDNMSIIVAVLKDSDFAKRLAA